MDYLTELENQIKDQRDLKEIASMKEIMFKAVEQHVTMCDDLVEDLVDGLVESEESIKASQRLLGIEMDFSIEVTPESKMLLDDYNSR